VYFLSDEERSFLVGRLLPEIRQQSVHPELRGWNWQQPPLSPVYDVRLTIDEIADQSCDSGRAVYLRRVLSIQEVFSSVAYEAAVLRRALADLIVGAKRIIYQYGPDGCLAYLATPVPSGAPELLAEGNLAIAKPLDWGPSTSRLLLSDSRSTEERSAVGVVESKRCTREPTTLPEKVAALTAFERQRFSSRVQDILAREPGIGVDALVTLALPVIVERQLSGIFLGLASHLAASAVGSFEGIVFDVRFGERQDFHRLTTTASALLLESMYGQPIDIGCLVYVTFAGERVLVERELHIIDDELRQWFIAERDERARLVSEEIDPGLATTCYATCPFWQHCHPS